VQLAADVAKAMINRVPLLLVHEVPSADINVMPNACEFDTLFDSNATPAALIAAGIYGSVAMPLKGGPWRTTSLTAIVHSLKKELPQPRPLSRRMVTHLDMMVKEAEEDRLASPLVRKFGSGLKQLAYASEHAGNRYSSSECSQQGLHEEPGAGLPLASRLPAPSVTNELDRMSIVDLAGKGKLGSSRHLPVSGHHSRKSHLDVEESLCAPRSGDNLSRLQSCPRRRGSVEAPQTSRRLDAGTSRSLIPVHLGGCSATASSSSHPRSKLNACLGMQGAEMAPADTDATCQESKQSRRGSVDAPPTSRKVRANMNGMAAREGSHAPALGTISACAGAPTPMPAAALAAMPVAALPASSSAVFATPEAGICEQALENAVGRPITFTCANLSVGGEQTGNVVPIQTDCEQDQHMLAAQPRSLEEVSLSPLTLTLQEESVLVGLLES